MQPIRHFPPMKTIRLNSMLLPRYCALKTPFTDEQKILINRFNPVHAMYKEIFQGIPSDILRWRVTARPSASQLSRAVLRARLTRRWKNAFADALRKRGYELDGKRIVEGKKVPALQGTLEIPIYGGHGLDNPYEALLRAADVAVDALEKLQRQDSKKETNQWRATLQGQGQQRFPKRAPKCQPLLKQDGVELEETMLSR